jgi:uncharacterized protein (TIGR03083 family)
MASFDDREQVAFEQSVRLFSTVAPDLAVGDGTWTARDVLAHLVTVGHRYTSVPRLADDPRGVDLINAEELAELADQEMPELLEAYAAAFEGYRALWLSMGPEHMWPFHGGGRLPTVAVRTNWLGEMLLHGYDVAAAAGMAWRVDEVSAADLLDFLRLIVPVYGHPGERLSVGLRPDGAPAWTIAVGPSEVSVVDGVDGADAVLAGPDWSLALVLYQRLRAADAGGVGVRIDGDPGVVDRLFGLIEKP